MMSFSNISRADTKINTVLPNIPEPPPTKKVTFYAVSAQESTVKKTAVDVIARTVRNGVLQNDVLVTREAYALGIACHGPDTQRPNIQTMNSRT